MRFLYKQDICSNIINVLTLYTLIFLYFIL